jgi:hypothetical protein
MKQFISTKLFFELQEASQKGVDIDVHILENSYDEFANLLFKNFTSVDIFSYRNTLIYIRVKFSSLMKSPEKKCLILS